MRTGLAALVCMLGAAWTVRSAEPGVGDRLGAETVVEAMREVHAYRATYLQTLRERFAEPPREAGPWGLLVLV